MKKEITWEEFENIEIRVGTILEVEDFPEARKPAYKLTIDLGEEVGVKRSSAQITKIYGKDDLVGKQVLCVCNFPQKQIGTFFSEVLTMGFILDNGEVILASAERSVPNGTLLR
ncbi:MAG: tRNA-binding protein [Candidatus Magasanikbacteria bacterium CG11_big_fil_rev_8_21_14_0_20_39_34]|uniref:tRNA-binding protein n=1 Tax=Candidatus Magasanikbacteria bacterium CG11_big_fil_rev_8_21_14_0_20_39_34 TaxID=1974653 RepID=A0A2H0N602_9BACT|nr:MAG: tRNA-binding protein [Candidatus Magasanikbacteria bacterium CG11_big_fil_rev_8_21_14_0_20_39_34]